MIKCTEKMDFLETGGQTEQDVAEGDNVSGAKCVFRINLSKVLERALTAKKLVYLEPEIRARKVCEIRKMIEKGTYKIDHEKVAESVLQVFMGDEKASNGKPYWNLLAANGEIVLTSQQYKTVTNAKRGVESVRKNAPNEKRCDVRTQKDGKKYFVLKAGNGEIIGRSQAYKSDAGLKNGMKSVAKNAPKAKLVDA